MESKALIPRNIPYWFADNNVLFAWLFAHVICQEVKKAIKEYVFMMDDPFRWEE